MTNAKASLAAAAKSRRPTRVEVDLGAIAANTRTFKNMLGEGCRLMAVVKADAYGHGAAVVAREALSAGAEWLAVALAQEALELREAGIGAPILILGYTPAEEYPEIIAAGGIRPAIYTLEQARALSAAAAAADARAPYHLKMDSGMSRIGFRPGEEALEEIRRIRELPNLLLEGCFTHFARADENDKSSRDQQFALFIDFADRLRQEGEIPIVHCANTAAAMDFPAGRLDMIRLGIGLYGLYPSAEARDWGAELIPALTWKSCLSHVKTVPAGAKVSYGHTWEAKRESVIGTLPVGYADGYSRGLSNKGAVLVRGELAPVIGRVCMDQIMVDLTDIPVAQVGDEAVLLGRQGEKEITADAMAALLDTINYEITCDNGSRVPRLYRY